jgi:hypothetical protein
MELWNWDLNRYESADAIRSSLQRRGRECDDDTIVYEATQELLRGVIDAAGGVERSWTRLHEAVQRANEAGAQLVVPDGAADQGQFFAHPAMEDAWYSLEEMFVWARTLDDRLTRYSKLYSEQGLIPAMADGPRRAAVVAARSRLLIGGVREARYLANLSLHSQSIRAGSKMGKVTSDGIRLPFPDRVNARVRDRWELTYTRARDGIVVANELMASVERFVDEMLKAFEEHIPDRFRVRDQPAEAC